MRTLALIAAAAGLAAASVVSAAVQYTVTNLGDLGGGYGHGYGLNASGDVGGISLTAGGLLNGMQKSLAGDGVTVLTTGYTPVSSGANSYAFDIDGSGKIVGFSTTAARATHAISGVGGTATDLHSSVSLGGNNSRAFGINGNGDIVGQAQTGAANYQAFYLPSGGSVAAIPLLAGGYTDALATRVNDGGTAVGFAYTGSWNYSQAGTIIGGVTHPRAFSYSGGTTSDLGSLGGGDSVATDINVAGAIVGGSTVNGGDAIDTKSHAFMYDGSMHRLNELAGATMSLADGINSLGLIVGTVKTATGQKAFVYRNNQMYDLNTLVNAPGWNLIEANDINDTGYITGYGTYNGKVVSFLLSPTGGASIPEPAAAVLMALAGTVFVGRRRR